MWNEIGNKGEVDTKVVMFYANVGETFYIAQGVHGAWANRIHGDVLDKNGQVIIRKNEVYCKEPVKTPKFPPKWPTIIDDSFSKILDLEEFFAREKSLVQGLRMCDKVDKAKATSNLRQVQKLCRDKKVDDEKKNIRAQFEKFNAAKNVWRWKFRNTIENEVVHVLEEHLGDFDDEIVKKDLVYYSPATLPYQVYVVEKSPVGLTIAVIRGECTRQDENGNVKRIYRADLYDRLESLPSEASSPSVEEEGYLYKLEFEDFPLKEEYMVGGFEVEYKIKKTEGNKSTEILFDKDPLEPYMQLIRLNNIRF